MKKSKKQFKSQAEYEKSQEWKDLQKEYFENTNGFGNVCEVTGYNEYEKFPIYDDTSLELFQWRKHNDFNDNTIEDFILVHAVIANFIREGFCSFDYFHCKTKAQFKELVSRKFIEDFYLDVFDRGFKPKYNYVNNCIIAKED